MLYVICHMFPKYGMAMGFRLCWCNVFLFWLLFWLMPPMIRGWMAGYCH